MIYALTTGSFQLHTHKCYALARLDEWIQALQIIKTLFSPAISSRGAKLRDERHGASTELERGE